MAGRWENLSRKCGGLTNCYITILEPQLVFRWVPYTMRYGLFAILSSKKVENGSIPSIVVSGSGIAFDI